MEGGMGSSSLDGEGVPRQTQVLVENGRLVGSMWSTRDSAQMVAEGKIEHAQSTGSASRGSHQSPPYTGCSDMILKSSKGGNSRDDLISHMENGYIVHSVMGAHTANPTSGDFSVTTSTILKVVDGQIAGPIKQAGLSGNIAKALSNDVLLGDRPIFQDSYSTGGMHVPDVLVMDGFRINPA
jgi:PmbA protein